MMHVNRYGVGAELVVDAVEFFPENRLRHHPPQRRIRYSRTAHSRRASATNVEPTRTSRPSVPKSMFPAFNMVPRAPPGLTQQCFGARDQLRHRKRLHQIVVGAAIKAAHAILDRIACG